MMLEALLANAHLAAILALVAFLGSEAAPRRSEWLNAAALHRLPRVRRLVMGQVHRLPLMPLSAVFLARGDGR